MNARALFAAASLSLVPFGLLVAMGAHPATSGFTAFFTDLLFWPIDSVQTLADPQARLFCAIAGGVCAGWGVMLWLLAREPCLDGARLVRLAVAPLLTWFVVDSTGSALAGAPLNAFGNALYLALLLAPLLVMARVAGKD